MLRKILQSSACLMALIFVSYSTPSHATSCRRDVIASRSAKETAIGLLNFADRVGVGIVRDISVGTTKQQEVEILFPFKGPPGKIKLTPYEIDRVSTNDWMIRHFNYKNDELRLFALLRERKGEGYAGEVCSQIGINGKPLADLVSSLILVKKQGVGHR